MTAPHPSSATADASWHVVCLCADWCGTCREWRPTLAQVARSRPRVRFSWIDIEDQADAMGDLDIETFPTLLIAQGDTPRFFGAVLPHAGHLERLLDSLVEHDEGGLRSPEAADLLQRLRHAELEPI